MFSLRGHRVHRRAVCLAAVCALLVSATSACADPDEDSSDGPVGVALIIKTETNPFFVAIQRGAQERAADLGFDLTVAAGREDGDVDSQITAVDAAVERGDKAILITPSGRGVDGALERAREAGVFVVALDTKPVDPDAADITFATDNFEAGRLIGAWAAAKMAGRPAVIAMLDLFGNRGVESDSGRNQGFLTGIGIPVADPEFKGDEAPNGDYAGGTYRVACRESTLGAEEGGRTAMDRCLAGDPDINLVYTINEPAASGAIEVLQRAGNSATVVSVDGGCDPGMSLVATGAIGATAQQYPLEMAIEGVDAIAAYLDDGTRPLPNHGIDMVATGVALVTDDPQRGVPSIDVAAGLERCWGAPA
ncbi:substrate-binding domain-containing protein [Mycolicibacterium hippocampi]|uniref:substrate-binding domain-containing protein n=1 Tax=Mycolicibacterium hippocampi TaxID=659824 RepID=UPI0035130157